MEPREIRIGNWFMSAKHDVPFQWQASDFAEVYNTQAKPIPLSPEILLKCGFEYEGATTLTRDNFSVYFKVWNDNVRAFAFYLLKQVEVPCLFVHQLQNVFHSLTGEELTIEDLQLNGASQEKINSSIEADKLKKLCDTYGVPPELLGNKD